MVPLGHCNWFWRRLLYNYWTESSSNGNSISKGKSAAIATIFLEQLCFSFKTIISCSTKQAILNFTKRCIASFYKLFFCNSTVQFLDFSCKRKCPRFQDKLLVSSWKGYCHAIGHGTSWQQSWMFITQCKRCMNVVSSRRNNTPLKEGWCMQYFLEN